MLHIQEQPAQTSGRSDAADGVERKPAYGSVVVRICSSSPAVRTTITRILKGKGSTQTPTAADDLCLVKLVIAPSSAGPAGAPSTSKGIGIEIRLPAPNKNNVQDWKPQTGLQLLVLLSRAGRADGRGCIRSQSAQGCNTGSNPVGRRSAAFHTSSTSSIKVLSTRRYNARSSSLANRDMCSVV